MSARHKNSERRPAREYIVSFFRDLEKYPGYAAGFYGGLVLLVLGIMLGLVGIR